MATKDVTDLQVCRAVRVSRREDPRKVWSQTILSFWTGECEKVCIRAMERAARNGFLEYGVSIRTAWLTNEGQLLIGSGGAI